MIDVQVLQGASVRRGGSYGRVVKANPWSVYIEWQEGETLPYPKVRYWRSDSVLRDDIQVLTLGEGWIPFSWVIGAKMVRDIVAGRPTRNGQEQ